jgi:hypothetical protein
MTSNYSNPSLPSHPFNPLNPLSPLNPLNPNGLYNSTESSTQVQNASAPKMTEKQDILVATVILSLFICFIIAFVIVHHRPNWMKSNKSKGDI